MALLDCRGCQHRTNTVFVDFEDLVLGEQANTFLRRPLHRTRTQ